jgi:hypothetical protein
MELKNVNPNGDNVVASNININNFIFLKIVRIGLKNKHYMLFILKYVIVA